MKPNVIFLGTPEFSVPVLQALITNFNVSLVISQPDKPIGRKREIMPSPIKKIAIENNIEVITPTKIMEVVDLIKEKNPDFIVSCAYGQIVPPGILTIPKYYALNVHASLLPKYRGAAPIQRAIMAGETETGVTIMEMEEGLDTGGSFIIESFKITELDNYQTVSKKLAFLGASLIIKSINNIINNNLLPTPQDDSKATYAHKITRSGEIIDLTKPSKQIFNQIRALSPKPGAIIEELNMKIYDATYEVANHDLKPGIILDINKTNFKITTIDGYLVISSLQIIGKRQITALEYFNQNQNTSQN